MKPAARLGDSTVHGGSIVQGSTKVWIGGQPAARLGDPHVCPLVEGVKPHLGGPILVGSTKVLIEGQPAARVGDDALCVGPPDKIASGCSKVLIG